MPARSVQQARRSVRYYEKNSRNVTVLIAGLEMPFLSGPEFVQKVLEINPALPAVLVTNYVGEHIPDDIIPLVRRILPKPFTKAELSDAVEGALARVPS
jgi:DNA-binding NarL/FixJ family response regulator